MSEKEESEEMQPGEYSDAAETSNAASEPKRKSPFDLSPTARKRLWTVAVLLCVVAIVAGIYLTYTAYLAGGFLKAVEVNGSSQALFGSDLLIGYTAPKGDGEIDGRSVVVDTSGEDCSFSFKLYNYLPGDKNKVNDKEVRVHLTVTAQNASTGWSVDPAVGNGVDLDFMANHPVDHTYKVTFPKSDLQNNVVFTIKAEVDADKSPGTNFKMLAVKVAPSQQATVTPAGVTGEWVGGSSNVQDFDAYSYRVTATGAANRVTIKWSEDVELDPHFETNHSGATVDRAGRTATFDMDPGSQTINFYQAPGKPKPGSWESIVTSCKGETIKSATTTG